MPQPTATVLRNWREHTIPLSLDALAQWCRENPSPDVKPKGVGNSTNLAFLASTKPEAAPFGHPKDHDIAQVWGCAFDLDKGSVSDITGLIAAMRAAGLGGVLWETHNSTAEAPAFRLLTLYDTPCPPRKHRVVYHAFATEFLRAFNTATQFNENRGHNPPRSKAQVLVLPGKLMPWQVLYVRAGTESKSKEQHLVTEREQIEGEPLDAAGEVIGAAIGTFWPSKGDGGHRVDLAFGRVLAERTSLSLDAIERFATCFTEDSDSVRTSAERYRAGDEQLFGWPTLTEVLGSKVDTLDELLSAWPAFSNAGVDDDLFFDEDPDPPVLAPGAPPRADLPKGWTLSRTADVFGEWPAIDYLQRELGITPGPPTLLAGFGFSGKSLFAQDLALSVLTGTPVLGNPQWICKQGGVIHLDYEQGPHLTSLRYQRLARGRGLAPSNEWPLQLVAAAGGYLEDIETLKKLEGLMRGQQLLIIDSLRASCPTLEENDSASRLVLDRLGVISGRTGCSVVVIHHAPKPTSGDHSLGVRTVRGTGAFYDAATSVIVLHRAEKGAPVQVHHSKERTRGVPLDDFQVTISGDGDGPLTLQWQAQEESDPFETAAEKVLELASTPVAKATLQRRVEESMPAAAAKKLIRELIQTGRLVDSHDTYHRNASHLPPEPVNSAALTALLAAHGSN